MQPCGQSAYHICSKLFYLERFKRQSRLRNDTISIQGQKGESFGASFVFSSPEPLGSQGELIGYPLSRRPSVLRRPSVVVVNNFKHLLLRNRWADQSQILCGASLGRGNDILFAASGSHDQDGRHAHIW